LESIDLRDIDLSDANLSDANLSEDYLFDANLSHAYLADADLSHAYLADADLRDADLRNADLRDANLFDANLFAAILRDADLRGADLSYADLRGAYLRDANLRSADLHGANLRSADLRDANLRDANLRDANLSYADLSYADLRDANLRDANLRDANLRGANLIQADLGQAYLTGAEGVSKERLEQQAKSLEGTIMPDGTIYSGRYATREFEPSVSFEVGEGWEFALPETPDELPIQTGPKGGLLFTHPRRIFDPTNLSQPKELPAPENADEWVSWFQKHPNLDTSKPVRASVGDVSGKRIDVTVTSTPENYPKDLCGEQPCVPLYPTSESAILSYEGWKDRFIIVDVEGETVLIDVFAPTDKFDEVLPKAQKVLDSVEWKGG